MVLDLVMSARKLRYYFNAYTMVILLTFSLKEVLKKANMSNRMTKWSLYLTQHDIKYES